MILEGVCTTLDKDLSVNAAALGPLVDEQFSRFVLRPYVTSHTFRNLQATRSAVMHVVDDVLFIARLVTGQVQAPLQTFPALRVPGQVLSVACRWYELEVLSINAEQPRSSIETRVVHVGRVRDFWGFNRAKHAVLEAAILATRLHLVPRQLVEEEYDRLRSPIEKTAGAAEREAFQLLIDFVTGYWNLKLPKD